MSGKLKIDPPASVGLMLSYRCNTSCRYCIYACSPKWKGDWISVKDSKIIFAYLGKVFSETGIGGSGFFSSSHISFSNGLHFTGGEPFLNYKLLLELTALAKEYKISMPFVETNCFWAKDDDTTFNKLASLRDAGMAGLLVSVNPFNIEFIPFESIERVARIGNEIFGHNLIIYQEYYFQLFKKMGLKKTISFEEFLNKQESQNFYTHIELLPMGRAPYKLQSIFKKYPAGPFFKNNCIFELTRNWHNHIDNYCNYIPGFCAGISLGDFRDWASIFSKSLDLNKKPVLAALADSLGSLYEIAKRFGYNENRQGYISKCHLCADIRKHIAEKTDEFTEIGPKQFYTELAI